MDRQWMRLIEQGGDASVGSALVRLARQASSVHMMARARQIADEAEAEPAGQTGVIGGTEPRLRSVAELEAELAEAAAADRTEVSR